MEGSGGRSWLAGRAVAGSRALGTRPDEDAAVFICRDALALNEFVLQIFQIGVIELELPLEGAVDQALRRWSMAIAWSRISSKVIAHSPLLMRRAEDGVRMGKTIRAHLYRTWLTKKSGKSWERMT